MVEICKLQNIYWLAQKQEIFWPFSPYRISPKHGRFKHALCVSNARCIVIDKGISGRRLSLFVQI